MVRVTAEVDLGDVAACVSEDEWLSHCSESGILAYVEDKTANTCIDVSDLAQKLGFMEDYLTNNELFEYMVGRLGVDDLMDRLEQEISQED